MPALFVPRAGTPTPLNPAMLANMTVEEIMGNLTQAAFTEPEQSLDTMYGAPFIGVIIASFLFGVTSLQAYWYFHHYPRDPLKQKLSVGSLWLLDTAHTAATIHAVYYYMVKNFGNVTAAYHIVWSIQLQVAINVVIIVLVQSLYASRIWRLSGYHRGFLGYVAMATVLGGFGIGVVLAYEIYSIDTFIELNHVAWVVEASLSAATGIDAVLALAMCWHLKKSQGKDQVLNSRISTIMQYTLSSGLLTSACSLAALAMFTVQRATLVYLGIEFLLTKLYAGSYFALLNARRRDDSPTTQGASGYNGGIFGDDVVPGRDHLLTIASFGGGVDREDEVYGKRDTLEYTAKAHELEHYPPKPQRSPLGFTSFTGEPPARRAARAEARLGRNPSTEARLGRHPSTEARLGRKLSGRVQTPPQVTVEQRTSVYADDRTRVADVKPSERWLRTTAEDEREDGESVYSMRSPESYTSTAPLNRGVDRSNSQRSVATINQPRPAYMEKW
ncbi:hypothetical protein K523DRAFT_88339 [Schizophyllum commune Tattone D]|nr:hypothetical protein K523DRAFT_88339 [Schizophyllum commune Tattone D]